MAMFNKADVIELVEATGTLYIHDEIQNPIIAKCWSVPQNINTSTRYVTQQSYMKGTTERSKNMLITHFMNQQQYIHKRKKWKKSSCHQLTNG